MPIFWVLCRRICFQFQNDFIYQTCRTDYSDSGKMIIIYENQPVKKYSLSESGVKKMKISSKRRQTYFLNIGLTLCIFVGKNVEFFNT